MNTSPHLSAATVNDTELVARSLAGDRQAFGQIVARYQTLICGLGYSATGSLSRSEDLAQETFVAAWKHLRELREPGKLRSWLCGIARNNILSDFRRQGREPVHAAAELESAMNLSAPDASPASTAVSNEEAALLWREIGQLPEIYREPLILFYREHQSLEKVAQALELNEDAVAQRLTRGRKLLHDRMLAFVEDALTRTNPGKQFTMSVQSALPLLAVSAQAAATTSVAKGGVAAKSSGWLAFLAILLTPFLGVLAAVGLSWASIRYANTPKERRDTAYRMLVFWLVVLTLALVFMATEYLGFRQQWSNQTFIKVQYGIWGSFSLIVASMMLSAHQRKSAQYREGEQVGASYLKAVIPLRFLVGIVVFSSVAAFWWILVLAWQAGDRQVLAVLVGAIVLLGAWKVSWLNGHPLSVAHRRSSLFEYLSWGLILAVVNWRLDVWLAPTYGVSVAEMRRLLPMSVVHCSTLVLLLWLGFLATRNRSAEMTEPK